MLSPSAIAFFKHYTGFQCDVQGSALDQFHSLAAYQGWKAGSNPYLKHFEKMRKALPSIDLRESSSDSESDYEQGIHLPQHDAFHSQSGIVHAFSGLAIAEPSINMSTLDFGTVFKPHHANSLSVPEAFDLYAKRTGIKHAEQLEHLRDMCYAQAIAILDAGNVQLENISVAHQLLKDLGATTKEITTQLDQTAIKHTQKMSLTAKKQAKKPANLVIIGLLGKFAAKNILSKLYVSISDYQICKSKGQMPVQPVYRNHKIFTKRISKTGLMSRIEAKSDTYHKLLMHTVIRSERSSSKVTNNPVSHYDHVVAEDDASHGSTSHEGESINAPLYYKR